MVQFSMFKNTFLLVFYTAVSCGRVSGTDKYLSSSPSETLTSKDSLTIVVGANRTEAYLPLLKGKKVGVVANQTTVIFKGNGSQPIAERAIHLVDSLLELGVAVQKVFAPEHGFRGDADAGEHVKDGKDTKTGLPLISLYGKNKKPSAEQLKGLDIVVFDIQDVGVRFYTYISTLHYVMEACAEAGIAVMVLDRPNPNGHYIDGPTLEIENQSFLGIHPIPLVHGMTIGEYAQMINGEKWLKNGLQCPLHVIKMEHYAHNKPYSLPFRPSPNLPNDQAIMLYPSLGLFEGTNINAGRGTEFQFQRYGAPFLDKNVFTFSYTPQPNFGAKEPKHKGKICYGEDLSGVKPLNKVSLEWLIKAYQNCTDKTNFFNTDGFTKHAGTAKLRQQIEAGMSEEDIRKTWVAGLEKFKKTRQKYLMYE